MNLKKRIAAIATAAACSLSMAAFGTSDVNDVNVFAAGVTGKTAFEITEDMTIGWNLGNSLDCSGAAEGSGFGVDPKVAATKWGNPEPTQALFDAVQAGGFNTVRIPTTWYEHIKQDANGFWEIDPLWMDYVKKTVDYAYNNGMYVILNIHHEEWINVGEFTDTTKAEASDRLEDIWTQISETFADYDQRLVFEGMNEPRQTGLGSSIEWSSGDTNSRQYINDLNAIFVDVVRSQGSSANKERVLMLPGYCASSDVNGVRAINVDSSYGNVALSVHAYLPYFFTMDTSNMGNHEYKADGSSASGYGANYRQELQTFFNNMKSVISEKNVPIIIGEFSASDFGNTDSRVNWAKDYLSMAEDAKIPCVLWDNNATYTEGATPSGENHGYINRKSNKWYQNSAPVIEAMMQTVGVSSYELPVYTPATDFSWDNVTIGSDWVELFKSEEGQQTLDENGNPGDWANIDIPDSMDYLNENYRYVMFAKATTDPTLVVMTSNIGVVDGQGWNYIMHDGTSTEDFVYNFNYTDMKTTVEATGDSMDNATNLFASAHGAAITVYGVYAVPVNSQPETTEPTEPTTEQPTETETTTVTQQPTETTTTTVTEQPTETTVSETTAPTEAPSAEFGTPSLLGDVDCSGIVELSDLTTLAKFILNSQIFPLSGPVANANADVNSDKLINTTDSTKLSEYVLEKITSFN